MADKKTSFAASVLKPFKALRNLGEKPVTIRFPKETKPTAERYRGFHTNDWDKCIGCGTCAEICDNDAIRMIEIPDIIPETGKSNLRPAIDYGRCCWCALCVDVCTTNSLKMTREYIHIDEDLNSFMILPTEGGIHKKIYPEGYCADKDINFLELERIEPEETPLEERVGSFVELVRGFSKEQAIKEAERCVACGLCTDTCPAHMNIPEYIDAIWRDDLAESARQIYKTNPLPEVCGRICTHKCETACSLGVRGEPISIRWLKRYAMDNIPLEEYDRAIDGNVVKPTGKKVAIVGSGPAGLTAGYYLALMGVKPVIYEKLPKPGGMMRYGIPEYRLPYAMLDKDIVFIQKAGVEIKTNTAVGKDITLEELKKKHDAVLLATGLHLGRSTRVKGSDHKNVYQSIDLLRDITEGKKVPVDEKIVVIGGGNVAMDISRSLARLQMQKYGKVNLIVTSLESEDIMPADKIEIKEAREEGIVFYPGRGPKEVVIENGKIKGLATVKCTRVFDENHRFAPEFDENDKKLLEGTMIVESIGQAPDFSYLESIKDQLEYDGRRIKVDEYYQTNFDWLFIAGDAVKGPDVINGVATGHQAALGFDMYLNKKALDRVSTVDALLDYAVQIEKNSYNYYKKFVNKFPEPIDKVIKFLAEQEKEHRDNIKGIKKNKNIKIYLSQKLKRKQMVSDLERYVIASDIDENASVEDVLQVAIQREKKAYEFYRDFEKQTKNKELKFIMEYLMEEELKHKKKLEEIYLSEIYNNEEYGVEK